MLPKENRLDLSKEFSRLKKYGLACKTPFFTLLWQGQKQNQNSRVGFVVSNKIGKAVVRNRIRRVLREAVKSCSSHIPTGINLAIIASPRTMEADQENLKNQLIRGFQEIDSRSKSHV